MKTLEIRVPDIGDFRDVEVIELMVKEGEKIAKDQSLVLVESDKASMEIPSPEAGVVRELKVKLGDKVSEGSLLLLLDETDVPQAMMTLRGTDCPSSGSRRRAVSYSSRRRHRSPTPFSNCGKSS